MFKIVNYKDSVAINLDDFEDSEKPIPLYVASNDGIYKIVNYEEIWKKVKKVAKPWPYIMGFSMITFIAVIILIFILFIVSLLAPSLTNSQFLTMIISVLFIGSLTTALISYLLDRLIVSIVLRSSKLIGELIAPWNEILGIYYANVKTTRYYRSGVAIIKADWKILCNNKVVTIPNVSYPRDVANSIKKKFRVNLEIIY